MYVSLTFLLEVCMNTAKCDCVICTVADEQVGNAVLSHKIE